MLISLLDSYWIAEKGVSLYG